MIEFSEVPVEATGGDFVVCANSVAPIFEQFAVLEAQIEGIRLKSRGLEGVVPSREELRDLVLGNSRERDEFRTRGRATSASGDSGQVFENELFVERLFQGSFDEVRSLLMIG